MITEDGLGKVQNQQGADLLNLSLVIRFPVKSLNGEINLGILIGTNAEHTEFFFCIANRLT